MIIFYLNLKQEVPNVLDCDIIVSKFKFQSRYYVPFQTNAFGKGINLIISPAIG